MGQQLGDQGVSRSGAGSRDGRIQTIARQSHGAVEGQRACWAGWEGQGTELMPQGSLPMSELQLTRTECGLPDSIGLCSLSQELG